MNALFQDIFFGVCSIDRDSKCVDYIIIVLYFSKARRTPRNYNHFQAADGDASLAMF
jgi:hypothetical protein